MPADGKTYRVNGDIGQQLPWILGTTIPLLCKARKPNHVLTWNLWQRLLFSFAFIAPALLLRAVIVGVVER